MFIVIESFFFEKKYTRFKKMLYFCTPIFG